MSALAELQNSAYDGGGQLKPGAPLCMGLMKGKRTVGQLLGLWESCASARSKRRMNAEKHAELTGLADEEEELERGKMTCELGGTSETVASVIPTRCPPPDFGFIGVFGGWRFETVAGASPIFGGAVGTGAPSSMRL